MTLPLYMLNSFKPFLEVDSSWVFAQACVSLVLMKQRVTAARDL